MFELLDSARGFQAVGNVCQVGALAGLAHGLAEAEGALRVPSGFFLVGQATTVELPGAEPLLIQERRQCQFHPGFQALKALETIGANLTSLLVDVVRPGFRFRSDPMRGQSPIHGRRSLPWNEPDFAQRDRRQILDERTHFRPWLGSGASTSVVAMAFLGRRVPAKKGRDYISIPDNY